MEARRLFSKFFGTYLLRGRGGDAGGLAAARGALQDPKPDATPQFLLPDAVMALRYVAAEVATSPATADTAMTTAKGIPGRYQLIHLVVRA